jgi:hypothetical protein
VAAVQLLERPFREAERSEIQITPSSPSVDSFLCSLPFDEPARTYARSRVYNSRFDKRRSGSHRHRTRADENDEGFDQISGAANHRSEPGLKLSSKSG